MQVAPVVVKMAATNKCSARSNKPRTATKTTKRNEAAARVQFLALPTWWISRFARTDFDPSRQLTHQPNVPALKIGQSDQEAPPEMRTRELLMPKPKSESARTYAASLRSAFGAYRVTRFAAQDHLFEQRPRTGGF
jgi:hypothetical protein